MTDEEYFAALFEKANEELHEVETAENFSESKEELADLLEVVRALCEYNGFSLEEIIEKADNKVKDRGGFSKKIFLIGVE